MCPHATRVNISDRLAFSGSRLPPLKWHYWHQIKESSKCCGRIKYTLDCRNHERQIIFKTASYILDHTKKSAVCREGNTLHPYPTMLCLCHGRDACRVIEAEVFPSFAVHPVNTEYVSIGYTARELHCFLSESVAGL